MLRILACVGLCLTMAACGGLPKDVLNPVAASSLPPDARPVKIFVATTRAPNQAEPDRMFGGDRAKTVNHASMVVSVPGAHKTGEIEWPSRSPGDPKINFVTVSRDLTPPDAFFDGIRKAIAAKPAADRDVLVFIHGYNTRYEEAVYRLAQIVHDSGFKGVPVLFTWPSRGELLAYPYDRESAVYSRDDLEATLRGIASKTGARKFDILAHSMGNFLMVETLRQAAIRGDGRFGGKLGQVMMAAPDIDIDVFRRQLQVVGQQRLPITIFVSKDDKALGFSKLVWGSTQRAGAFTVDDPEIAKRLEAMNITVFDLSDLKTSDRLGHGKFAASPDVVKLIGSRLADDGGIKGRGATIGESIVVVGSSLGSTVGSVAGGVVAAPVKALSGQNPIAVDEN
ncbi:alpha/beta hydrolase [uncultured Alsobacter sp.]|uniref:alpha/beta hydrolase n=1 Tax=uncultured Alsobacter sp. TaxID=1748258 RepID=UPI0025EA3D14|nr:alpha/beta hydrolase [uncultured Alsobacter sp.]